MPLRDLQLFQRRIAVELNHLHAVQQRLRNRVRRVRRADEQDIRQIVRHVHVMIREGAVLLRVQHLQKGAGRTSVEGCGKLVHLVQHHHRVGDAAFVDAVHDAARHGADVGAPVSADIRLVVHAAETHPHVFPSQGAGDAPADARLPRSGRADEQKNGAGLLLLQVHDRDLLDHPLLHLLQAVMVFVQNATRGAEINMLRLLLFPGEARHKVQVVVEHAGFHALLPLLLKPSQHLLRLPARGLVHAGLRDFPLELLHVRHVLRVHFVQLLLEVLHLPLDGGLPDHLLVLLLLGARRLVGNAPHLQELVQNLLDHLRPLFPAVLGENRVPLLVADLKPGRHGAGRHAHRVDAADVKIRGFRPVEPLRKVPHLLLQIL